VQQGISQLLGESVVPPPDGGGGGGVPTGDVTDLVAQAQQLYDEAQAALKSGDLGTYQAKIDELAKVITRLAELVGTPAPSPSPSPAG